MKKYFSLILLLLSVNGFTQKPTFNENSVSYLGKTYKIGDIVHLWYGSNNNKDFAFVNYGKPVGGINIPGLYRNADANWSKADVEIEKIEKKNGVIWLKCKPVEKSSGVNSILGNRIFINLEGAVDNNEIKGVDVAVNNTPQQDNVKNAPVPAQKEMKNAPAPTKKTEALTKSTNTNPVDGKKTTPQKQTTAFIPGASANGKLYFRTYMWTGMYGSSLDLSWIFLGNDGTIVKDPENGVNPINYTAELNNNAKNVGKYKIEGNKLNITWSDGKKTSWSLEYRNGDISAMDGGIVSRPKGVPDNYKLSGQYSAGAVLPNVSSVHTLVFSNNGSFTLNKSGAVSTRDVSAISTSDSKGTYKISGNTLWLNFDNGNKEIAVIYIWDAGAGKKYLVINKQSFPQEG